jgi:hypothetical protein
MTDTITIIDGYTRGAISAPLGQNDAVTRHCGPDGRADDIVLVGGPHPVHPIRISLLLRPDGSWDWWRTEFLPHGRYLHIDPDRSPATLPAPTEEQQRTVARWFFEPGQRPYGIPLGATLTRWAYGGENTRAVAARYGYAPPLLA